MTRARSAGQVPGTPSKADEARTAADRALEALAEQLDRGNSQQLDAFLKAMGRFHHYSVNNIFLILGQRPDATRVAGFHTWKSLGRSVRKGERGIVILAPMQFKPKEDEIEKDGKDRRPVLRFRAAHVFDIVQTEGEPLPEPARAGGDPGDHLSRLEAFVREQQIELETSEALGGAEGVSTGGRIVLLAGLAPAARFSVLCHELAHEMLHKGNGVDRPSKQVRELEAEAVAHVVSDAIGLETRAAASDYIRLYQGDRELLAASLGRIQRTACVILTAIHAPETARSSGSCGIPATEDNRVQTPIHARMPGHARGR